MPKSKQSLLNFSKMKEFKIQAFFVNGYEIADIKGKNLGEAFYIYYKEKAKKFTFITGFILIK